MCYFGKNKFYIKKERIRWQRTKDCFSTNIALLYSAKATAYLLVHWKKFSIAGCPSYTVHLIKIILGREHNSLSGSAVFRMIMHKELN